MKNTGLFSLLSVFSFTKVNSDLMKGTIHFNALNKVPCIVIHKNRLSQNQHRTCLLRF